MEGIAGIKEPPELLEVCTLHPHFPIPAQHSTAHLTTKPWSCNWDTKHQTPRESIGEEAATELGLAEEAIGSTRPLQIPARSRLPASHSRMRGGG